MGRADIARTETLGNLIDIGGRENTVNFKDVSMADNNNNNCIKNNSQRQARRRN